MPNLEDAIRERAYHLWIADGQPEGQADMYWLNAQREILTTSVEGSAATLPPQRPSTWDWLRRNRWEGKIARSVKERNPRRVKFHASIVTGTVVRRAAN